jgi:hypothetical protein
MNDLAQIGKKKKRSDSVRLSPPHNPNPSNPACPSGRTPNGQRNSRSPASIARSLMLAIRRSIKRSAANCQFSLP